MLKARLKRPSLCGFAPTYPTTLLEGFAGIIFDDDLRNTELQMLYIDYLSRINDLRLNRKFNPSNNN